MVSDLRRTVPWLETWLLGRDDSQVKVSFTKQLGREGKSGIYYLPRPDIHSSRQGDKKSEFTITLLLICIAGRKCSVLVFLIRYSSQKPVSMFHGCAVLCYATPQNATMTPLPMQTCFIIVYMDLAVHRPAHSTQNISAGDSAVDLAANAFVVVVVDHSNDLDLDLAAQTGWVATAPAVEERNYHMIAAEGGSADDRMTAAADLDNHHKPFARHTGLDSVLHMIAVVRVADVGQ